MLDNLDAIEKQVFRTYWDDGLLDLFAGIGVLSIGLAWMLDFPVGGAIVPALLAPLWAPFRERFIEPRLGLVEFGDQRVRRNTERLRLVAFCGVGTFALAIALYVARTRFGMDPATSLVAGLPAVLLAILAAVTAFLVAAPRFLAYAAVLVAVGMAGAAYGLEPGPILVLAAVPVLAAAIGLIARFVRDNPATGDSM